MYTAPMYVGNEPQGMNIVPDSELVLPMLFAFIVLCCSMTHTLIDG